MEQLDFTAQVNVSQSSFYSAVLKLETHKILIEIPIYAVPIRNHGVNSLRRYLFIATSLALLLSNAIFLRLNFLTPPDHLS